MPTFKVVLRRDGPLRGASKRISRSIQRSVLHELAELDSTVDDAGKPEPLSFALLPISLGGDDGPGCDRAADSKRLDEVLSSEFGPEMTAHTCPSAPCEPGSTLLGVVGPQGTVAYLTPPLTIDDSFVATARRGRSPEKRFRFAAPCVEEHCAQWTGSRCGVIDAVLATDVRGSRRRGL
jgi:hypothetical protein